MRPLQGRTVWAACKGVWNLIDERNVALTSAGVAFYALFAMFPAVGALIALWGFWQDPAVIQAEMELFREILPVAAFDIIEAQVSSLVASTVSSLTWTFVISLGLALWSAMWAVDALLRGLNALYRRPNPHSLRAMLRSVALSVLLIAVALVALTVIVVLPIIFTLLPLGRLEGAAVGLTHTAAAFGVVVMGILLLYAYGPNRNGDPVGRLLPGVVIAVALWACASLGFSYFLTTFGRYNEVYGGLAAAAALLMWLYLSAYTVLLGAAFNAELDILEKPMIQAELAEKAERIKGADAA